MTVDTQILTALRQVGSAGVSGADLAQRLHMTRAAVWARIVALRALGYDIQASPHRGYCLVSVPDLLQADDLLSLLGPTEVVGRDIRVVLETTSTNDVVEKLAAEGVAEGVVVFAESQTRGRGRLGRKWLSPAGKGLWFSVLLRPDLRPPAAIQVTIAAATALVRAIHGFLGLDPEVKWPNDILVRGRKVAGILTELGAELDHIKHVVLGIGIDVNLQARDFPPDLRETVTSLSLQTGRSVPRTELAAAVLRELDHDYARIRKQQFQEVAAEWAAHCSTLGCRVSIRLGGRILTGMAESLDEDGALLLRTEHGHLERVIGGDVSMEKQNHGGAR